jgi:hypothetical protein
MAMIKLLKLDETRNWDAEWLRQNEIRRMFGVYIFDSSTRVHCCEFTPSYEAHFVESQADHDWDALDDVAVDTLDNEIRQSDAHTPEVSYFHCHIISSMKSFKIGLIPPAKRNGVVALRYGWSKEAMTTWAEGRRDDLIGEAMEYCQENGV